MAAVDLFRSIAKGIPEGVSQYLVQRRRYNSEAHWEDLLTKLRNSTEVYVGNLAFYTTESQIYELFSKVGDIKRVIMGLNNKTKFPCGFCFVLYYTHEAAAAAKKYISGTKLDDRVIRVDVDPGFEEGRQFGRSERTGGQIRDDVRTNFDAGRGGYGGGAAEQQESNHEKGQELYQIEGDDHIAF